MSSQSSSEEEDCMSVYSVTTSSSVSIGHADSNQQFELVWHDLAYEVPLKGGDTRTILKKLSGRIRSRELVAVMGPSGAGKSTLLECIIGKRVTGKCLCRNNANL